MRNLGRFFLWLFAALGGLVIIGTVAVAILVLRYEKEPPQMPDQAYLWLDLTAPVPEKPHAPTPFSQEAPQATFLEHLNAIEKAKDDPRITGIVALVGYGSLGTAHIQELRNAIADFRKSGKMTIAYAEDLGSFGGGTLDYYTATAFEQVWLQPSGGVGLTGLALETPYFAKALDKLNIDARFEQRQEFKGGADPFTRTGMSVPVRQSLEQMVDGWMAQIVRDTETDRPQLQGRLRNLVDNGPYLAEDALKDGLIDRIAYRDEFEDHLRAEAGVGKDGDYTPISPAAFLAALAGEADDKADIGTEIALIQGVGAIVPDGDGKGLWDDKTFDPYLVADALRTAREDDKIRAVLLRVDSPGGAYAQSDMVWREVQRLREAGKPVVAQMTDMAASGGYFVSMGADHVIAQPGTLTGSIGVYAGKFVTQALWDKLGVKWERVQTGKNAGMWSMVTDFSDQELVKFRQFLDFVYDDFTSKAADNRGLDKAGIDRAARGRIWTGEDALQVGLVDELGGLPEAKAALRRLLKLDEGAKLSFTLLPHPPTLLEGLQHLLSAENPLELVAASAVQSTVKAQAEAVLGDLSALQTNVGMVQMPPIRISR